MSSSLVDRIFSTERLRLYGIVIVLSYCLGLLGYFLAGEWLIDRHGAPVVTDFMWLWTGGKLVLAGQAPRAFDYGFFSAMQVPIAGPPRSDWNYYHWIYPPSLFFYVAPLGLLPYYSAFFVWTGSTLALYLASVRAILPHRSTVLLALTPVPVSINFRLGHTAFLAAGLMGFALVLIETSPFCAGLVLGGLSYKPQLGLLFPLVLLIAGQWRVIAGAAVSTGLLVLASACAFGPQSWLDFAASMGAVDPRTLMPDANLRTTLQTVFGLFEWAGAPLPVAWAAQGAISLAATVLICLIWRQNLPYAVKAAALAAGTLLVTPYLLAYDLVVLSIAVAFLLREALASGFQPGERLLLLGAFALLFLFERPVGAFVLAIVFGLILRRAFWPAPADSFEHGEKAERHQPA